MMRTKIQVEAYVSNLLREIKSRNEKLMRGFKIAKLYFDVKEFDKAEEYLQGFLSVKNNYSQAYKLLGQIYEATGSETVKVINAYKKCFEIDPKEKEILLKICELYANSDVTTEEAKFWSEKAEKHYPDNAAVFKLKVKANDMQPVNSNNNANTNIDFYESESAKYPKDAMRKMRLLRLYVSGGRLEEAYKHVVEAELQETFSTSLDWYKCVVEVLSEYKKCKQEEKLSSEFYEFYLLALCLYASLSIAQSLSLSSATSALWSLDQELSNFKDDVSSTTEPLKTLLSETKAHYLFLCATLILNKAQKESLSWRTLSNPAFACLLASMTRGPLNTKESWSADENKKKFLKRWYNLSFYRCSQIGHMLKTKYDNPSCGDSWLRKIQDDFFHHAGRNRICQVVFCQSQTKDSLDKSFLHKCLLFKSMPNIPSISDLEEWDGVVQISQPANLALLVWICLHYYDNTAEIQPEYPFALFLSLPYGCEQVESFALSSLSQLDVQTFLMATVKCAAQNHATHMRLHDSYQPYLLPFSINATLCSNDQVDWWAAVSRINSAPASLGQYGQVLESGLKTIRLIGMHGMNVDLVTHLAKTWAYRLSQQKHRLDSTVDFNEHESYVEAHALLFWKKSLLLIEAILSKNYIPPLKSYLFESRKVSICDEVLKTMHQEGQMFLALHLKKSNNLTEALRILKAIKNAESYYETAKIYIEMAGDDVSQLGETLDEGRSDHLLKAKDALNDALLLASSNSDLEKKIKAELDDIETKLLSTQNFRDYEFVSEFTVDCTSFGGAKFPCTPQKTNKSAFMTSSTPFAKKTRDNTDLEIRLGSLTHYVDQRFKNMSEDNQKLMERITILETKLASHEAQMMMWTMPFNHMMQAPHFQIYPGVPQKLAPEPDGRMSHQMMERCHQVIHQRNQLQAGMVLPGLNNPQSMPNLRPNLPMMHQDIYRSPQYLNNQYSGNFLPASSMIDADNNYSGYKGMDRQEGMLPSMETNFLPKYPPVSAGGKPEFVAVTPKSMIPAMQGATPISSSASASKTAQPQVVTSSSSLAKLLLTAPPSNPVTSSVSLKQNDIKNSLPISSTTNSSIGQFLFPSSVKTLPSSTSFSMSPLIKPTASSESPKVKAFHSQVKPDSEPKSVFGGLTFNSTPIVKKTEKASVSGNEAEKEKMPTKHAFSNFSFGGDSSASTSFFNFSVPNTSAGTQEVASAIGASSSGFSVVPKTSSNEITSSAVINEKKTVEEHEGTAENDESVEEYEPIGEFKLVSLPVVNVMTGEEDSNKLFGERGKLYRMDFESKQWKERGIGEVKILENKVNQKARILMRRDQVFKVCANHFITSEMKLKGMETSENCFCWIAMDYAEEEMRKEQFCLKFKTREIALAFKECFESCQKNLAASNQLDNVSDIPSPQSNVVHSEAVINDIRSNSTNMGNDKTSLVTLADKFKPKEGEWSCVACYVRNPATSTACLSCESPKPGCESISKPTFQSKSESQISVFGTPGNAKKSSGNLADQFKPKEGEWSCVACYVRNPATSTACLSCESPKPGCEKISKPAFQSKSESQVTFGSQGGFTFSQLSSVGFGNISFGSSTMTSTPPSFTSTSVVAPNIPLFGSDITKSTASLDFKSLASAPKFVFGSSVASQPNLTAAPFSFGSLSTAQKTEPLSQDPPSSAIATGFNFNLPMSSVTTQFSKSENLPVKNEAAVSIFSSGFKNTCEEKSTDKLLTTKPSVFATPDKKPTLFGNFNISTPAFSFAGLSSNIEETLQTPPNQKAIVSDNKVASPHLTEDECYRNVDGEDSHIHFEPIVKLPDNYEIKTLEENETVLYSENAKVFRFSNNEWKEKGAGIVKLLRNEETGKVRILMRREKIHKICCNHYILPDMQLHPLMNNKRALVWYAHDYVDGDQTLQQLCIRFKSDEQAEDFKRKFEKVVEEATSKDESVNVDSPDDCVVVHVEEPADKLISKANDLMLPKHFYNYLNAPTCKGCIGCKEEEFVFDSPKDENEKPCDSLKTPKAPATASNVSGVAPSQFTFGITTSSMPNNPGLFTFESLKQSLKVNDAAKVSTPVSTFKFGSEVSVNDSLNETNAALESKSTESVNQTDIFKSDIIKSSTPLPSFLSAIKVEQGDSSETTPLFGSMTKTLDFSSLYNKQGFGVKSAESITPLPSFGNKIENVSSSSFASPVFGSLSNSLDFTALSSSTSTFKTDSNFSWKGAGEKVFSTTPEKPKSVTNEENEEEEETEERDIHFEPVINLPEVEVTTGEENEDEIYKQRSMLYRFDGQWKERGVGDMKILKNKESGAYRLVLRRDQIHKVVCNHLLSTDMNFKFMESSERALCWYANDFSEEPKVEQFALKFKTVELAGDFLKKIEDCQSELRSLKQ